MRTCDEILELLSARLDGGLSGAEDAELDAHLHDCAECRALAADLAALHELMPGLNVEPPPALLQGVMAQIGAETPAPIPFPDEAARSRQNKHKWRTWGATAAVLAVVVLGAATLRGFGGASSAAPTAVAGGAAAGGSALSPDRSAEAAPQSRASDGAALPESGGTPQESALQEADPAEGAVPSGAPTADESQPKTAPRTISGGPPGQEESTQPSAPPEPAPGAVPESASPSVAPMCVGLPVPLTEAEALQLLYEERFAKDFPDAALDGEGDAYEYQDGGASLWQLEYMGLSEDGMAYTFRACTEADGAERRFSVSMEGTITELDMGR